MTTLSWSSPGVSASPLLVVRISTLVSVVPCSSTFSIATAPDRARAQAQHREILVDRAADGNEGDVGPALLTLIEDSTAEAPAFSAFCAFCANELVLG